MLVWRQPLWLSGHGKLSPPLRIVAVGPRCLRPPRRFQGYSAEEAGSRASLFLQIEGTHRLALPAPENNVNRLSAGRD